MGYLRLRVCVCARVLSVIHSSTVILGFLSTLKRVNSTTRHSFHFFSLRLPVHLVRSGSSSSCSCSRSWSWSWFCSESRLCLVLGLGLGRVVVVVVLSLTWFLGCDSNGNFLSCCIQYLAFLILFLLLILVLVVFLLFLPFYGGCFALLFFHHLVMCVVGKIQSRQHTYTDVFTYLEYCRHTQLALMPGPGAHTHILTHS